MKIKNIKPNFANVSTSLTLWEDICEAIEEQDIIWEVTVLCPRNILYKIYWTNNMTIWDVKMVGVKQNYIVISWKEKTVWWIVVGKYQEKDVIANALYI